MKRSDRLARLHRISHLHEKMAATSRAEAQRRHDQLEAQLARLQDYWHEYSARLETLKQTTHCAKTLAEHLRFLEKLDEAIAQQQAELEKSARLLQAADQELMTRRIDAKKMERLTESIRLQEAAAERKALEKEADEFFAGNRSAHVE